MNLHRLNRRLVLEEPIRLPDGSGGYLETWSEVGILWAEMTPGSGRERDGFASPLARVPWRIVIRAAPVGSDRRPVAGQRFREGSRQFGIRAVAETDTTARYLTCFAEEERVA